MFCALMLCGLAGCSAKTEEINEFGKLSGLTDKLDFSAKYVQSFSNGFLFAAASAEENKLRLSYENPQTGEILTCYAQTTPCLPEDNLPPNTVEREEGEVTLTYYDVTYKFVPADYEQTAEDEAAIAEGSLLLSVGGGEVEESLCQGVLWQEDGVYYELSGLDLSLTAEELLDMAAQIVTN